MAQQALLELPLDDDLLKVLSSDKRRDILRLLTERRMTGTELAQRLGLGKPAVSEHLKKLLESDLVTRLDDPDRRWVYYELSPRGKSLLEPQKTRFYLVMAIASLALVLGVALAVGAIYLQGALGGSNPLLDDRTSGVTSEDAGGLGGADGATDLTMNSPQVASATTPVVEPPPPATTSGVLPGAIPFEYGNASFQLALPHDVELPPTQSPGTILYVFTPFDVDAANQTVHVQTFQMSGTKPRPAPTVDQVVAATSASVTAATTAIDGATSSVGGVAALPTETQPLAPILDPLTGLPISTSVGTATETRTSTTEPSESRTTTPSEATNDAATASMDAGRNTSIPDETTTAPATSTAPAPQAPQSHPSDDTTAAVGIDIVRPVPERSTPPAPEPSVETIPVHVIPPPPEPTTVTSSSEVPAQGTETDAAPQVQVAPAPAPSKVPFVAVAVVSLAVLGGLLWPLRRK